MIKQLFYMPLQNQKWIEYPHTTIWIYASIKSIRSYVLCVALVARKSMINVSEYFHKSDEEPMCPIFPACPAVCLRFLCCFLSGISGFPGLGISCPQAIIQGNIHTTVWTPRPGASDHHTHHNCPSQYDYIAQNPPPYLYWSLLQIPHSLCLYPWPSGEHGASRYLQSGHCNCGPCSDTCKSVDQTYAVSTNRSSDPYASAGTCWLHPFQPHPASFQ